MIVTPVIVDSIVTLVIVIVIVTLEIVIAIGALEIVIAIVTHDCYCDHLLDNDIFLISTSEKCPLGGVFDRGT